MPSIFRAGMSMDRVETSIEVSLPVEDVYAQWTDFESFPQFMEGIKRVDTIDHRRLRWHAEIGGKDKSWEAEVTDQVPNRRIAWRSTSGAPSNGTVSFDDLNGRTRVRLVLEYEPEGAFEEIGSKIGAVSARVQADLRRFREFVEARGPRREVPEVVTRRSTAPVKTDDGQPSRGASRTRTTQR
jgi:uncharacterized membrane protein